MQANPTVIPDSVNRFLKLYHPFIEKNSLEKHFSQAICSKYVFWLFHAPKFQIFSTKLDALINFTGKHLCRNLFFNKVLRLLAKERLLRRCFPVSFTKYFLNAFFAKHLWVTASAKYQFLFGTLTLATMFPSKCFLQPCYFKYFRDNTLELLANGPLWRS